MRWRPAGVVPRTPTSTTHEFLAQDPDRQAIADGGRTSRGRAAESEAVAAFKAVLRRNPDHVDALRMLALALVGDAKPRRMTPKRLLSRVTAAGAGLRGGLE